MKDKFGQFEIDFSDSGSPEEKNKLVDESNKEAIKKSKTPFFTQEELDEIYKDEPGGSDADKLEYAYWFKKFGNKKVIDIKESLPEGDFSDQERKKILEQAKKTVEDMKRCLRLSLIERAGLNSFKNNQDYFSDFKEVLKIAKNYNFRKDPLGAELLSGLGSYRILGTIEKRIQEDDYKKMMKYFQDLERKGSIAAIRIIKTPRYLALKKALIQAEESKTIE